MKGLIGGFTLIELIIVIVIIGVLAATIIPKVKSIQPKSRDVARKSDIRQIDMALDLYASENNWQYPNLGGGTCVGMNDGERCLIGRLGGRLGSTSLNNILKQHVNSVPIDPLPNRPVGDRYIYFRGWGVINCGWNGDGDYVYNKAWLLRFPEVSWPPNSITEGDKICFPGRMACCGPSMGCANDYFCLYQVED